MNVMKDTSVKTIGTRSLFLGSATEMDVYYKGTSAEFEQIEKGSNWLNTKYGAIYYYSATKPTTSGKYWHYVNNVPTIW